MAIFENYESILNAIGGLGLFLFGIVIMTSGLRSLAGDAMRSILMRLTRSPLSGAMTGTLTTAVLQSSSATTVAAIGFVSAGLIGFSESLGIIFGANLGTTITGWLVALLGFKLKLGSLALIFVFIGVLMRIVGKGNVAKSGYTLAGFSLIFVGITFIQDGMGAVSDIINTENLPADTLGGRLKLLFLGMVFTIITQSSSAGVATALSALYVGAINFEQAAALIIGMDVGTTVKAVLATIGASTQAKRTGLSHVVYNILTASVALMFITPFTIAIEWLFPTILTTNSEIALVAFHTFFNILGISLILPFTDKFAQLIKRLIPHKSDKFTGELNEVYLKYPRKALLSVQLSIYGEIKILYTHILGFLENKEDNKADLNQLQIELDKTHRYLDQISLQSRNKVLWERSVEMFHTLDHLQRLHERCDEEEDRAQTLKDTKIFKKERKLLIDTIENMIDAMESKKWHKMFINSKKLEHFLDKEIQTLREDIMEKMASGAIDVPEGTEYLESIRWLIRVTNHLVRISIHYEKALLAAGK